MFQVTDRAAQQLETALLKAEDAENVCLRNFD